MTFSVAGDIAYGRNFEFAGVAATIPECPAPPSTPPPSPPSPPPSPHPPPSPPLATNVACLPIRSDEALLDFSGAKPQRFLHCAHPPAERARIVPVPQGRACCTTTWAALPVTAVRRTMKSATQTTRSSTTSAPILDAPVRPYKTRATWELVRWPRTNAVPAGTGVPQRPPRRASCAAFGNVFDADSTSRITDGADTQIDLYIENTTYYHNWDGGSHHMQTRLNGQFAQINLDGPNSDLRPGAPAHETTFRFQFKRRDTGQPVSIPWMQFTFFDFDENMLSDWLVGQGAVTGDGREARLRPLPPSSH